MRRLAVGAYALAVLAVSFRLGLGLVEWVLWMRTPAPARLREIDAMRGIDLWPDLNDEEREVGAARYLSVIDRPVQPPPP